MIQSNRPKRLSMPRHFSEVTSETEWTPFERAVPIPMTREEKQAVADANNLPLAAVQAVLDKQADGELFKNNRYQVAVQRTDATTGWPPMIHLSIKRLDREPIHDWRDLQRIKNELVGPRHEGVELYPAEERLVDLANQYHLWVFTDPEVRLPFGFRERAVNSTMATVAKAKQRI